MAFIIKYDNETRDYIVSIDFYERHIHGIIRPTKDILEVDHKTKIQKSLR